MTVQSISSANLSLFDFDRFPPSIANLPAAMTINNITVYPTFRYNGKDAGATIWNPWGYGQQLTLQSGTVPTYNNGSPLFGSLDDSVLFNGDGYYKAIEATLGDVALEDVIFEIILKIGTNTRRIASKKLTTGWDISAGTNTISYRNGGLSVTATANQGTYVHVIIADNRSETVSNGIQIWANASAGTSGASTAASQTNAIEMCIGEYTDGSSLPYDSNIIYFAMWKQTNWIAVGASGMTEIGTVAKTRFMQLTGMYPQQARGTALPTAYTRNLASYVDKIESDGTTKLYYVGDNWPRVCSRIDSAGKTIKGYLEEGSSQNICRNSDNLSVIWNQTSKATIVSTPVVVPDGSILTGNTLHEDGTAASGHYIYSPTFVVTSGSTYTVSFYAKAANRSWIATQGLLIGLGGGYFNISTGATGSTIGTSIIGIISCRNGWYQCYATSIASSSGTEVIGLLIKDANAGGNFDGLNQDSIYIWGVQVELGSYPSSHISTISAAVTRPADVLTFVANDGNVTAGQGTLVYDILLPSYDVTTDGYTITLSNAGSSTVNIKSGVSKTGDGSLLIINNTTQQAKITGTTDIAANTIKTITNTWNTNSATVAVNSASEGTPATTCTIPTITQIDLSDEAGANQINGLIANLKIYNTDSNKKRGS